jgi:hypothetical protein
MKRKKTDIIKSAKSVKGILIRGTDGINYFRVYSPNKSFIDYRLVHSDLEVEIKDPDAFFYTNKIGERLLDHGPRTLGMEYDCSLVISRGQE